MTLLPSLFLPETVVPLETDKQLVSIDRVICLQLKSWSVSGLLSGDEHQGVSTRLQSKSQLETEQIASKW